MRKGNITNPSASHLREHCFRAYETWLIRLVDCYPEPLVITPSSPGAATFSRRIRDAANAFLQHHYDSPLSYDDFEVAWKGTIVRETGKQVIIAPRTTSITEAIGSDAVPGGQKFFLVLASPTLARLNAVANLYVTGVTMTPTSITGEIPAGFAVPEGVGLYPQEDGSHLLL